MNLYSPYILCKLEHLLIYFVMSRSWTPRRWCFQLRYWSTWRYRICWRSWAICLDRSVLWRSFLLRSTWWRWLPFCATIYRRTYPTRLSRKTWLMYCSSCRACQRLVIQVLYDRVTDPVQHALHFHKILLERLILLSSIRAYPICPRGLRRGSVAARLPGLRVRIQSRSWLSVSYESCVLSGRVLCDGPITCPNEPYQVWCVWVWSLNLHSEKSIAH